MQYEEQSQSLDRYSKMINNHEVHQLLGYKVVYFFFSKPYGCKNKTCVYKTTTFFLFVGFQIKQRLKAF